MTVRPIITLDGAHEVNEVWLENVEVPVENRIHEENQGWTCAKFLLAHERSGIADGAPARSAARPAARSSRPRSARPAARWPTIAFFRRKLADVEIDLMALEFTELRTLAARACRQGAGCRELRC